MALTNECSIIMHLLKFALSSFREYLLGQNIGLALSQTAAVSHARQLKFCCLFLLIGLPILAPWASAPGLGICLGFAPLFVLSTTN
jgi:hypothetical protein